MLLRFGVTLSDVTLSTGMAFLLALAAFLLSWFMVGRLRHVAVKRQVLDVPNPRSSHRTPTPRGGGLALLLVAWLVLGPWAVLTVPDSAPSFFWCLGPATLVAVVSLLDDLYTLSAGFRFLAHGLAAGVVCLSLGPWTELAVPAFPTTVHLGWLGWLITTLWLVGLTNVYNFMDGVDGIAGGQGMIAGLGFTLLGLVTGQSVVAMSGLVLAGACLGFLLHNWPPASIFMGDVGAAFLGFSFASLAVLGSPGRPRFPVAAAALLFPFLFDSSVTLVRRLARGENIFTAHRSHLYQRMTANGWSHRKVSILYVLCAAICSLVAVCWQAQLAGSGVVFLVALGIVGVGLSCLPAWIAKH